MSIRFVTASGPGVGPKAPAGSIILSVPAAVDLSAGDFVNIFESGGLAKAQKADVTDDTKPADGFVVEAVTAGSAAEVFGPTGANTQLSGLTPGALYFLAASGGITSTVPTTGWLQIVGRAVTSSALLFHPQPGTLLS